MPVTAVAPKYQCAETTRIARGRGSLRPRSRQAMVKPLRSSVFIGLPWPMNNAGMRPLVIAAPSNFQQRVGPPETRPDDELRDIIDRFPERRLALVAAVVGMAVNHRLDVIEAVDRIAQALRPEILVDGLGLAFDGVDDRRIMEHGDAAFGAQRSKLVLKLARLVQRFLHERLGDRFAERSELTATVSAHEALHAGEADAANLDRLLVEDDHPAFAEDSRDFFGLAAFIVMIAEHAEHRDGGRANVLGQDFGFAGLAEIGEVAAQHEHVRIARNLGE